MGESTVYEENREEVEAFWTLHGKPFEGLATALHLAAEHAGVDTDFMAKSFKTALYVACRIGFVGGVREAADIIEGAC